MITIFVQRKKIKWKLNGSLIMFFSFFMEETEGRQAEGRSDGKWSPLPLTLTVLETFNKIFPVANVPAPVT